MKKPAAPTTKFTFQSGDIQIEVEVVDPGSGYYVFTFQSGDIQIWKEI